MPAVTLPEVDFLPASYRASLEHRRRTIISTFGLAAILLVGLGGILRQAFIYRELVRTRDSLRVGLPVLEKASQEEQVLKARLDQSLRKANQVAILKGGVPVGWLILTVIKSLPDHVRINKLMLELQEAQPEPEQVVTISSTQSLPEEVDKESSQLNDLLRRLDKATLKLSISGEAITLTSIVKFLQNLQSAGIFNQVDLETIDETVAESRARLVRFTISAQLPYQRWRIPTRNAVVSTPNQPATKGPSAHIADSSSSKLETYP